MVGVRRQLFKEKESYWKYSHKKGPSKHWNYSNFCSNFVSDTNWYKHSRADIFQRAMNDGYRRRMMEEQEERIRKEKEIKERDHKKRYEEEYRSKLDAEREKKDVEDLEEETDKMIQLEDLIKDLMAEREKERGIEKIEREKI